MRIWFEKLTQARRRGPGSRHRHHTHGDDHPAPHVRAGFSPDAQHQRGAAGPDVDHLHRHTPGAVGVPRPVAGADSVPPVAQRGLHPPHPFRGRRRRAHRRVWRAGGARQLHHRFYHLLHHHHPVRRHHQGRRTPARRISTGQWMAPASSSAATPSPVFSSP